MPFERGEPDGTQDDAVSGRDDDVDRRRIRRFASRRECQTVAMAGASFVGTVWSPGGETAGRIDPDRVHAAGLDTARTGMEVRHL